MIIKNYTLYIQSKMELRINEHVDVAFVKALSVLLLNKKKKHKK